jgi:hypothetical protein
VGKLRFPILDVGAETVGESVEDPAGDRPFRRPGPPLRQWVGLGVIHLAELMARQVRQSRRSLTQAFELELNPRQDCPAHQVALVIGSCQRQGRTAINHQGRPTVSLACPE